MGSTQLDSVSLTLGIGVGVVLMAVIRRFAPPEKGALCNPGVQKDQPKVATMCTVKDVEDLLKDKGAVAYCRCWRSKKFPMCDGSHVDFNKASGDNTGPLVFKKST